MPGKRLYLLQSKKVMNYL